MMIKEAGVGGNPDSKQGRLFGKAMYCSFPEQLSGWLGSRVREAEWRKGVRFWTYSEGSINSIFWCSENGL